MVVKIVFIENNTDRRRMAKLSLKSAPNTAEDMIMISIKALFDRIRQSDNPDLKPENRMLTDNETAEKIFGDSIKAKMLRKKAAAYEESAYSSAVEAFEKGYYTLYIKGQICRNIKNMIDISDGDLIHVVVNKKSRAVDFLFK